MNHYEILELTRDCDQNDIKRSYRRLAKGFHPDKNKNKGYTDEKLDDIKDRYIKIHKAHDVLSDPELREEYDRTGISSGKGDLIIDPYQALMRMMEDRNETGVPDVIVPINSTISDLYIGFTTETEFTRVSPCSKCDAMGTKNKKNGNCSNCKGRGAILETIKGGESGYMCKESTCVVCRGTGLDPDIKKCSSCKGDKYDRETIVCDVEIPEGSYEGYFVKFEGEGNFIPEENRVDPNIHRSDVLFVVADVDYAIHQNKTIEIDDDVIIPVFRRGVIIKELKRADRADLMFSIQLTFEESICGITKKFIHLDGSIQGIELDDSVVNNDTIVLKGRGMPVILEEIDSREKKGYDTKYGDMFIRFEVNRPIIDKGAKRKIWQILTDTPYQKRQKVESASFMFLENMISEHKNKNHDEKTECYSDDYSENHSED
jgi:DnaJ-class molecular chaperone